MNDDHAVPPAAVPAGKDETELRYCRCADPENCTETIPGYVCRKGSQPAASAPPPLDLLNRYDEATTRSYLADLDAKAALPFFNERGESNPVAWTTHETLKLRTLLTVIDDLRERLRAAPATPRADPTDASVPLKASEFDELERRLAANEPQIREHTRAWALVAIRQLRAAPAVPATWKGLSEFLDLVRLMPDSQVDELLEFVRLLREARGAPAVPEGPRELPQ